jgi:arginine deiminase
MLLKNLDYQFSIWDSDDITLPPSVVDQHFHIWIFSHNFEENPNMKMLIANGSRQSNVISSLAHLGAGMVITIC